MGRATSWRWAVVFCWALAGACGGSDSAEKCTADELAAALGAARAGDTVRVGACRIAGSFEVPAGVTLTGHGPTESVLLTTGHRPVLRLVPGASPTRVADLGVLSSGNSGIWITGTGSAVLERVRLEATRGIGVAAEDVDVLELRSLELVGPIVETNRNSVLMSGSPPEVDPDLWATHGLLLVRVADARLEDVTARGFASFGALLVDGATTWERGGAPRNLGTGLMISGGSAVLRDLDLSGTFRGVLVRLAYGGVFADAADVESSGLVVDDGDNFGLLHDGATARHTDLVAGGNGGPAVWIQDCDGVELAGAGMALAGNRLAGVVAVHSSNVTVSDGRIDDTALATRIFEESRSVQVGDGVQVVGAAGPVTLRRLALSGNERAGLLIDLGGGTMDGIAVDTLAVDGFGTQYGALVQNGDAASGWDTSVSREGATADNDVRPHADLSIVGRVDPDDVPAVDRVGVDGVNAIIDPNPPD
ncbi:MAG: hypothetical protein HY905_05230 [Deltaproteobacteria bacterium]|nr:hypothetical protein [Deltaproteobacteria bacterium]